MFIPDTRGLTGIYRPSVVDKLIGLAGALWAIVTGFALLYMAASHGGIDRFDVGFASSFALVAMVFVETQLRTVTIDEDAVSQRSPLGLYRQSLRHEDLSGLRLTYAARGNIVEVRYRERWIVFCSNRTFRRCIESGTGGGMTPGRKPKEIGSRDDSKLRN